MSDEHTVYSPEDGMSAFPSFSDAMQEADRRATKQHSHILVTDQAGEVQYQVWRMPLVRHADQKPKKSKLTRAA